MVRCSHRAVLPGSVERLSRFHRWETIFPGARLVDDMSWDHGTVRECDWVPGCYYLERREVIERFFSTLGIFCIMRKSTIVERFVGPAGA
jgi:hypothetical protein